MQTDDEDAERAAGCVSGCRVAIEGVELAIAGVRRGRCGERRRRGQHVLVHDDALGRAERGGLAPSGLRPVRPRSGATSIALDSPSTCSITAAGDPVGLVAMFGRHV